jgi:hypothetical protein
MFGSDEPVLGGFHDKCGCANGAQLVADVDAEGERDLCRGTRCGDVRELLFRELARDLFQRSGFRSPMYQSRHPSFPSDLRPPYTDLTVGGRRGVT